MMCLKSKCLKEYCTNSQYKQLCVKIGKEMGMDLYSEVYIAMVQTKQKIEPAQLFYWVAKVCKNMMSKTGVVGSKKIKCFNYIESIDYEGIVISGDNKYKIEQIQDELIDMDFELNFEKKVDEVYRKINSFDKSMQRIYKIWEENNFNMNKASQNSKFGYYTFRALKNKLS
jgi:hypothetical protein